MTDRRRDVHHDQAGQSTVDIEARALADLGAAVWRLSGAAADGLRHHVDTVLDALAEAGVVLRSHRAEPFDPGMALRVTAFQPVPGLERDEVIETLRPSVYLRGRLIALGEVIVGIPGDAEDTVGEQSDDKGGDR